MIIGSHVGCSGKDMMLGSVKEALSYGANTFMFYTGAPQNTRRKAVDAFKIEEAMKLMEENNIDIENIVVHAPYIINLANTQKPETFELAVEFLAEEIRRVEAMNVSQIVLHPGSHVGAGSEAGINQIIKGLNMVLKPDQKVKIALETMAGKGTECGRTFEEIKQIIDGVEHSDKLSVCIDTCHLNDAGYDVKDDFDGVLKEFDKVIGLDRISCVHINDSKNVMGSHKDRHENLGVGHIGFESLNKIVHHELLKDIPKLLETPYITENDESKKRLYPPYKHEIEMIKNETYNEDFISQIRKENIK